MRREVVVGIEQLKNLDINRYCGLLDEMLDAINIPDCVRCNDCHCDLSKHKHSIDVFC